ncbi:MAG TPA: thymidylate kinase [Oscillospiraceae bacterium]|nr:thymidylate kinase [Oscillospiraceae bacterium]HPF56722.1 thymidylate kinase [Clostridiales bacterium]HPK35412.1 thymidylate kinase [Oscillospiraceae bacterium]HPR75295.1 thymidylate kinase [Oscillospiraceae bacterium]
MPIRARFIAFEGCDGTGKSTQAALLTQRLLSAGQRVKMLKFPAYDSPSSGPVKMYLGGELAKDPNAVNPYAASSLYAVDRFCSFRSDWQKDYENGVLLVSDRYTTSNMIFQGAKLQNPERTDYIRWLKDMEYGKLGLPVPDLVLYLDLPVDVSEKLVRQRSNLTGQGEDIHESDLNYQRAVHDAGREIAENEGWIVINCAKDGMLMPPDELSAFIWSKIND